ncbi:hypothetical protein RDI58_003859 [Solanum bulbocastanum]|uniref:Uncharacterized protein n=1 Tax=Solanum bulbocastanum TaxID=147425 RepID=A0AAN8TWY4_SOLBU
MSVPTREANPTDDQANSSSLQVQNGLVERETELSHRLDSLTFLKSCFPILHVVPMRPTTLRACGIFARRSLLVVPSSPLAVWAGCPSLLHSFKLWIKGTNVVEWNSRQVTRSTVSRCEVQVVIITSSYALAPLTGTLEPANARENLSRSILHSSDRRGTKQGIASGIGSDSESATSCRTGVIQYVVPRILPLLHSFPILIVKHHEQQDVEEMSILYSATQKVGL